MDKSYFSVNCNNFKEKKQRPCHRRTLAQTLPVKMYSLHISSVWGTWFGAVEIGYPDRILSAIVCCHLLLARIWKLALFNKELLHKLLLLFESDNSSSKFQWYLRNVMLWDTVEGMLSCKPFSGLRREIFSYKMTRSLDMLRFQPLQNATYFCLISWRKTKFCCSFFKKKKDVVGSKIRVHEKWDISSLKTMFALQERYKENEGKNVYHDEVRQIGGVWKKDIKDVHEFFTARDFTNHKNSLEYKLIWSC